MSPLQEGNGSCLFEPRERISGQVDLRLLAKLHPCTDCPAHPRPYLATNEQPKEIPLNWKSQVFLLLWKAPSSCSWQNSQQHFLFPFFPSLTISYLSPAILWSVALTPNPSSPYPSQGKASGAAWVSVAWGSIYGRLLWAVVSVVTQGALFNLQRKDLHFHLFPKSHLSQQLHKSCLFSLSHSPRFGKVCSDTQLVTQPKSTRENLPHHLQSHFVWAELHNDCSYFSEKHQDSPLKNGYGSTSCAIWLMYATAASGREVSV